jgi:hypothetical protein
MITGVTANLVGAVNIANFSKTSAPTVLAKTAEYAQALATDSNVTVCKTTAATDASLRVTAAIQTLV